MAFDNQITRDNVAGVVTDDVANEIIQGVPQASAVMQLGTQLARMTKKQRRLPVLASLPQAYFVDGDTGLKQTTRMLWDKKFLEAEEIAAIVPIPEAVLDDSDYDIWGEVRPRLVEAFAAKFDAAVLHGDNKPNSWPDGLETLATNAGNAVAAGTGADLYDDILGEDGVIAQVEEDGFMVSGHVAAMQMRARLRSVRGTDGHPIFMRSMQDRARYELDGEPVYFPLLGALDPARALMFTGDWRQLVWAIRQDMTYKVLTEAVIQDEAGGIIYNLAQQDMVALRVVMRLAWQVPNPISRYNVDNEDAFPFAVLTPAA